MNQQQDAQAGIPNYDPAMINRLKKEIIQDIEARREWQEEYYDYPMNYRNQRGPTAMAPYVNRSYPEVDYDWWTDREEYEYQRNRAILKNELRKELMSLDKMNRRVGQINDPLVRQALIELLQEAKQQGIGIQELMQSLNTNNSGVMSSVMDRVTGPLKGIDKRSFGWGIGAALLGLMLLPSLTKSMHSITERAMGSSMSLENTQNIFERAREEFDNIVADAKSTKKQ